jgi:hypothetical protein
MIFVLETEEMALYLFPDEAAAIAQCEGLEVEAAIWALWDDAGVPLHAKFSIFPQRQFFSATGGEYHLAHDPDYPQAPLLELLEDCKEKISRVHGHPPLDSLKAIEQYLRAQAKRTDA